MTPDDLNDMTFILFGVCAWDYLTSLWFEYRLVTNKIRFRWQFVPYFLTRYFVLTYIIMNTVLVFIGIHTLSVCNSALLINSSLPIGLLGLVFSTWNLLTRTIIIWGHRPRVMIPLFVVGFIHLAIALTVSFVRRHPCVIAPPSLLSVTLFGTTTATIEFTILVLSLVGIRRASQHRESRLASFLKAQGIVYFVMVFLIHLFVVIAYFVQTDGITNLAMGLAGTCLGPVLSCRLVLSTLSQNSHANGNPEGRMHHIDCFELSEGQTPNPSGQMSTYIDHPKDPTIC